MFKRNVYEVRIAKHSSDIFIIHNELKQDVLSPFITNFSLEYAIRKVQKTKGIDIEWNITASVPCGWC